MVMILGCQNTPEGLEATIVELEKTTAAPLSEDKANKLIKAYQDYVSTYPDRGDQNADYLKKGAQLAINTGQFPRATALLTRAIKEHNNAKSTNGNILLLGEVYRDHIKNKNIASTIFQSGQIRYPSDETFSQEVDPKWPPIQVHLDNLKGGVLDSVKRQINYANVNDYIVSCAAYAMILPKDTLSPKLLFQAGQLAHQTQTHNKALEILDWMYLKYPDHPLAADALFLNGYILDSELKRFDEAKKRYEAFLKKYPDNEFAETTQFLLENLGVPAEEIIKRFEEEKEPGN